MGNVGITYVTRALIGCLLLVGAGGCSLTGHQNKAAEQKEMVARKKSNYLALHEFLASDTSSKNTRSEKIKEMFGKPDDVFQSGSVDSRFEIWTYEKVMNPNDEGMGDNIRLYFQNGRLICWQY